jgi:glutathione S-transferase
MKMKLYYAPGACSLATRISLKEAGLQADFERVDLSFKITERGTDYCVLNPKGSVPMLELDGGERITENVAILALLAEREPKLAPGGPLGDTRLLEMLSYLSSELHVAFHPLWHSPGATAWTAARDAVRRRLDVIEDHVRELYLFGPRFTVADAYLFVMLRWAVEFKLTISSELSGYFERVAERPCVRQSLDEEGLVRSVGTAANGLAMTEITETSNSGNPPVRVDPAHIERAI